MPTREQHRAAAATRHDVERHVTSIIRRGGDAEVLAAEIHQAYVGRYELRERQAAGARCTTHTGTALHSGQCPICGPTEG